MPVTLATRRTVLIGTTVLLAGFATDLAAQSKTTVKFERGNDNTAVQGKITGDGYHDYLLGAKAGQNMGVSLVTEGSAYFNILPPGSNDVAIYNSSIDGNDATGIILPKSGSYTVRVYLLGADADEGRTVPFTLSMSIM